MCLTHFVYTTADIGVVTTPDEQTTLTTLRDLKAETGLPVPPYECAEHEDSKLHVDKPGHVETLVVWPSTVEPLIMVPTILLKVADVNEAETETHSFLYVLMRTQLGREFIAGRGKDSRAPSDADIVSRIEKGIKTELSIACSTTN